MACAGLYGSAAPLLLIARCVLQTVNHSAPPPCRPHTPPHPSPPSLSPTPSPSKPPRTVHFFAGADKAKRELGWKPEHDFLGDVDDLVAAYKASGRHHKDADFSIDDKILKAVGALARA